MQARGCLSPRKESQQRLENWTLLIIKVRRVRRIPRKGQRLAQRNSVLESLNQVLYIFLEEQYKINSVYYKLGYKERTFFVTLCIISHVINVSLTANLTAT